MSTHRATRESANNGVADGEGRQGVSPVVLFIGAVLIAGMTCILYLWQQSQIVSGTLTVAQLDRQLTVLYQQRDDLDVQRQNLTSVTHVLAQATKAGMVPADSHNAVALQLAPLVHNTLVAQVPSSSTYQRNTVLPATNAAITSWWENAWDGLYSLVQ